MSGQICRERTTVRSQGHVENSWGGGDWLGLERSRRQGRDRIKRQGGPLQTA